MVLLSGSPSRSCRSFVAAASARKARKIRRERLGRHPGPVRQLMPHPGELPLGIAAGIVLSAFAASCMKSRRRDAGSATARHAPSWRAGQSDRACAPARLRTSSSAPLHQHSRCRSAHRCAAAAPAAARHERHLHGPRGIEQRQQFPRRAIRRAGARSPPALRARARSACGRRASAPRVVGIAPRELGMQRRRPFGFAAARAPRR